MPRLFPVFLVSIVSVVAVWKTDKSGTTLGPLLDSVLFRPFDGFDLAHIAVRCASSKSERRITAAVTRSQCGHACKSQHGCTHFWFSSESGCLLQDSCSHVEVAQPVQSSSAAVISGKRTHTTQLSCCQYVLVEGFHASEYQLARAERSASGSGAHVVTRPSLSFIPAPLPSDTRPTPFVVATVQRSGSGWLTELMNLHPYVVNNGEIFKVLLDRDGAFAGAAHLKGSQLGPESIIAANEFAYTRVSQPWSHTSNLDDRAHGFKWMLGQGLSRNLNTAMQLWQRHGVRVIVLSRAVGMQHCFSKFVLHFTDEAAHVFGSSAAQSAKKRSYKVPPPFFPKCIHKSIAEQATLTRIARTIGPRRAIFISYDELRNSTQMTLGRIQAFLSVEQRTDIMTSRSKNTKLHSDKVSLYIRNWAEVKRAMVEAKLERYLKGTE